MKVVLLGTLLFIVIMIGMIELVLRIALMMKWVS
jgi:hypothetical protein